MKNAEKNSKTSNVLSVILVILTAGLAILSITDGDTLIGVLWALICVLNLAGLIKRVIQSKSK